MAPRVALAAAAAALLLCAAPACARDILVGGDKGWTDGASDARSRRNARACALRR